MALRGKKGLFPLSWPFSFRALSTPVLVFYMKMCYYNPKHSTSDQCEVFLLMLRAAFPAEVQAYIADLPLQSGVLWRKAGEVKIALKLSRDVDFLASGIGHRAIWKESSGSDQIHLTLVLHTAAQGIISIDCHLNPLSFHEPRQALQALVEAERIEIHAVDAGLLYIGSQVMPWPVSRRQELAALANIPSQTFLSSPQAETAVLPPAPAERSPHPISLRELHQRVLDQDHYLEALSVSLQKHRSRIPGFQGLPEQRLIEQLHTTEQQAMRQARVVSLDQEKVHEFTRLIGEQNEAAIAWPDHSLWISIETAIPGYPHPRCAVLVLSDRDRETRLQERNQNILEEPSFLKLNYRVKIIDEQGIDILRFQTKYASNPHYWSLAPSHQCPHRRCQMEPTDLPRSLRDVSPLQLCLVCEQELQFWRKALAPLLVLVRPPAPAPEKRLQPVVLPPTPKPAPQPVPSAPAKKTKKKKTLVLPPEPAPRPFLVQSPPLRRVRAPKMIRPLSIEALPVMVGIPSTVSTNGSFATGEQTHVLFLKVPAELRPEHCLPGYGAIASKRYREGDLLILHILMRYGTQKLDLACLFSLAQQTDQQLLSLLLQESTTQLPLLLISDDPRPRILAPKTLPWTIEQREQLRMHCSSLSSVGNADVAKWRWLSETPPVRPRLLPPPLSEPSPASRFALPEKLPDSLMEQYAASLLREALERGETGVPELQALRRAYSCEVDASAQNKLYYVLEEQEYSSLHQLLSLPASHCWLTFDPPLPGSGGTKAEDVAALWIWKHPAQGDGQPSWMFRLIGRQAAALEPVYCYSLRETTLWRFHETHRCQGHTCLWQDGMWKPCSDCQQALSQWVTILFVLLRMLRGDYAARVNVESRTTTRLVWTKLNWEHVTVSRQHHVLITLDTDQHVVRSPAAGSVSRESWLAVLRQHRPDLIEVAKVTTARHDRRLASGKTITINPHPLTVYRRRDRQRKQRMRSSSQQGPNVDEETP